VPRQPSSCLFIAKFLETDGIECLYRR
jgi:hypothetical protein